MNPRRDAHIPGKLGQHQDRTQVAGPAGIYRYRVMIEHLCDNCGSGFSSIKPSPQFCCHRCYIEYSAETISDRAISRWKEQGFASKITAARKAAGYRLDPMAPIRAKVRSAVKRAIRRCVMISGEKTGTTIDVLGYAPEQLRIHIESLFAPGMTWANYGEWEIDHKHPISAFPMNTPLAVINAISNLQPLWRNDNRRKSNNVGI